MQDEKLRAIAVTLYERHKEAFEFIFECRPEPNSLLSVVRSCVQGVQGLILDSSGNNVFRFVPVVWDENLRVIKGDSAEWSRTGRGVFSCVGDPTRFAMLIYFTDREALERFSSDGETLKMFEDTKPLVLEYFDSMEAALTEHTLV